MNDEIQGVKVAGRRFKPVAFGVTIMMLGLVVAVVFGLGYERSMFTWFEGVVAAAAIGLLVAGWIKDSVNWTKWGLLVATFAYLMRFVFLLIIDPLGDSVLLALGVLMVIAGSYVLEVQDRRAP